MKLEAAPVIEVDGELRPASRWATVTVVFTDAPTDDQIHDRLEKLQDIFSPVDVPLHIHSWEIQ